MSSLTLTKVCCVVFIFLLSIGTAVPASNSVTLKGEGHFGHIAQGINDSNTTEREFTLKNTSDSNSVSIKITEIAGVLKIGEMHQAVIFTPNNTEQLAEI